MMTLVEGTLVCNGFNKILSTIHTTLDGDQSVRASIWASLAVAGDMHGRRDCTSAACVYTSESEALNSPYVTTTTILVTETPTVETITSIIYPSTTHSIDSSEQ